MSNRAYDYAVSNTKYTNKYLIHTNYTESAISATMCKNLS